MNSGAALLYFITDPATMNSNKTFPALMPGIRGVVFILSLVWKL